MTKPLYIFKISAYSQLVLPSCFRYPVTFHSLYTLKNPFLFFNYEISVIFGEKNPELRIACSGRKLGTFSQECNILSICYSNGEREFRILSESYQHCGTLVAAFQQPSLFPTSGVRSKTGRASAHCFSVKQEMFHPLLWI